MDKSGIFLSDFRRVSLDHATDRIFEGKFVRCVGDPFARHDSDALNNASWFLRGLGPRILKKVQDGGQLPTSWRRVKSWLSKSICDDLRVRGARSQPSR
jgi:hypothetical protein